MVEHNEPVVAASLLEKAQVLHDEHVAEAEAYKEKVIREADVEAKRILDEAETEKVRVIGGLEDKKKTLEEGLQRLREIEAEYRQTMISSLEGFIDKIKRAGEVIESPDGFDLPEGTTMEEVGMFVEEKLPEDDIAENE